MTELIDVKLATNKSAKARSIIVRNPRLTRSRWPSCEQTEVFQVKFCLRILLWDFITTRMRPYSLSLPFPKSETWFLKKKPEHTFFKMKGSPHHHPPKKILPDMAEFSAWDQGDLTESLGLWGRPHRSNHFLLCNHHPQPHPQQSQGANHSASPMLSERSGEALTPPRGTFCLWKAHPRAFVLVNV